MRLSLVTAPITEPVSIAEIEVHSRIGSGMVATLGQTTAVNIYIAAARQRAETITRRQLITATWDLVLDYADFPAGTRTPIEIPLPPLQSITSITYVDTAGATQTLSSTLYRAITESGPKAQPGLVIPVYGEVWPSVRDDLSVVTIRFVAGYSLPAYPAFSALTAYHLGDCVLYTDGSSYIALATTTPGTLPTDATKWALIPVSSAIPESVKNWMLLNVANLWENRESIVVSKGQVIDLSKTMADGLLDDYRIYSW